MNGEKRRRCRLLQVLLVTRSGREHSTALGLLSDALVINDNGRF